LFRRSILSHEKAILAPLADCGYGILQLRRLVSKDACRLPADDTEFPIFRLPVQDPVIFSSQAFHDFDDPHGLWFTLVSLQNN